MVKRKQYLQTLIEQAKATQQPKTDIECLRAAIIAEYDAVNMYERFAAICKNNKVGKIFLEIANEEKTHIGEFEKLADKLDPQFIKRKEEGFDEVEEF